MDTIFYIGVAVTFLVMGYFFAKKYLFHRHSLIQVTALIDRIEIGRIGDLWSPELLVHYVFYYDDEKFEGKDFVRIDKFIGGEYAFLADQKGFPVLVTAREDYIGEEYIETYLLERRSSVRVEFNTASLPYSRIYNMERKKDAMFQNVEIDFPWTR